MNKELFNQVLEQIKTHPETWDQKTWHCGTSHCFAGWTEILTNKAKKDENNEYCGNDTSDNAKEALGLSDSEALWLFDEDREIEDFENFIKNDGYIVHEYIMKEDKTYFHDITNYFDDKFENYDWAGIDDEEIEISIKNNKIIAKWKV